MSMTDLRKKTIDGALWVALEKWATRLLAMAVFLILGQWLSQDDFGRAALALSLAAIFIVFSEYGFCQAIIQRNNLEDEDVQTAFWFSCVFSFFIYVLILCFAFIMEVWYAVEGLREIVAISGLVVPISGLAMVPVALLERELNFKALAIRRLIGAFFAAMIALLMASKGFGVMALILQPVAAVTVGLGVVWFSVSWRPRLYFNRKRLGELLPISAQSLGIELLNAMQSNLDKLVVGSFFSVSQLGVYFFAQKILTIIMEIVSAIFGKISFSAFSKMQNDLGRLLSSFLQMTFFCSLIAAPIYGLLWGYGYDFISIAFDGKWSESVPLMILMIPSVLIASVTYFDKSVLLAINRGGASLWVAFGQFIFGIMAIVLAAPLGLWAVALARSLRQIFYWPVRIYVLRRYAGLEFYRYIRVFLGPALGFFAIVAGAKMYKNFVSSGSDLELVELFAGVFLCMASYVVVVFIFSNKYIGGLVNIFRSYR